MVGGMGTLPYIYEMAQRTGWISVDYIGKILAVSQVTPGPLACNIGTITGYRVNGIMGAFIANLGFVFPAIIFMYISYKLINKIKNNNKANEIIKFVRSAALAVMIASSITLFKTGFLYEQTFKIEKIFYVLNYKSVIISLVIFFISNWKKINSLLLILLSACIGVLVGV